MTRRWAASAAVVSMTWVGLLSASIGTPASMSTAQGDVVAAALVGRQIVDLGRLAGDAGLAGAARRRRRRSSPAG